MASIMDDLKGFRRSWGQPYWMQLATLSVLAATICPWWGLFSCRLLISIACLFLGARASEMSIYLRDEIPEAMLDKVTTQLSQMKELTNIRFIGREKATENFKSQMASYAPGLLNDLDFQNHFLLVFEWPSSAELRPMPT